MEVMPQAGFRIVTCLLAGIAAATTVASGAEPVAFIDFSTGKSLNVKLVGKTPPQTAVEGHQLVEFSPGRVSVPAVWSKDMPNPGFPGVLDPEAGVRQIKPPQMRFDIDQESLGVKGAVDLALVMTVYDLCESSSGTQMVTVKWCVPKDSSRYRASQGSFGCSGHPFDPDPIVRPRLVRKTLLAPGILVEDKIEGADLTFETRTRVLIQRVDLYRLPPSPMDARASRRLPELVWPRGQFGILDVWLKDLSDFMPEQARAYNRRALVEDLARVLQRHSTWSHEPTSRAMSQDVGNRIQRLAELVMRSHVTADEFYYDGRVALLREEREEYDRLLRDAREAVRSVYDESVEFEQTVRRAYAALPAAQRRGKLESLVSFETPRRTGLQARPETNERNYLERTGLETRPAASSLGGGAGLNRVSFTFFSNSPNERFDPYNALGRAMSQMDIGVNGRLIGTPVLGEDYTPEPRSLARFRDMMERELARGFDVSVGVGHHTYYLTVRDFPRWLQEKAGGRENLFDVDSRGHRKQPDLWSPELRRYSLKAVEALAREVASNPRIGKWFYWGEPSCSAGHSHHARQAFRGYLKERYGDIDGLNAVWRTQYPSFDSIEPPPLPGEKLRTTASGLAYEFETFRRHSFTQWWKQVREALRRGDPNARLWYEGWGRWDYILSHGTDQLAMFDAADIASAHSSKAEDCKRVWMWSLSRYSGTPQVDGEDDIYASYRVHLPMEQLRAAAQQHVLSQVWWGVRRFMFWSGEFTSFRPYSYGGPYLYDRQYVCPMNSSCAAIHVVRQKADLYNRIILNTQPVHPRVGILFSSTSFINSWPYNEVEHETFPFHGWLYHSDFGYWTVHEDAIVDGREDLHSFNVIFAPWAMWLKPDAVEKLRDWVRRGGVLISSGPIGAFDQYGRPLGTILEPALGKVEVTYSANERLGQNRLSDDSIQYLRSIGDATTTHFGGWLWSLKQTEPNPDARVILKLADDTPVAWETPVGLGRVVVTTGPIGKNGLRRLAMAQLQRRVRPLVRRGRDDGFHVMARADEAGRLYLGVFNQVVTESVTDTLWVEGDYADVVEHTLLGSFRIPVSRRGKRTGLTLTLAPGESTVIEMGSMLQAGRPVVRDRQSDIRPEPPLVSLSHEQIHQAARKIESRNLTPTAQAEALALVLAARRHLSMGYAERAERLLERADAVRMPPEVVRTPGDTVRAVRATGKITVDGSAEEWRDTPRYAVRSRPDTGGEFALRWDDENLYILTAAQDADLRREEEKGNEVNWLWMYDGILLTLNTANSAPMTEGGAVYDAKLNAAQTMLAVSITGRKYGVSACGFSAAAVRSAVKEVEGGYVMETAVPLAAVMLPSVAGADVGFDFRIVNNGSQKGFARYTDRETWSHNTLFFARLTLAE